MSSPSRVSAIAALALAFVAACRVAQPASVAQWRATLATARTADGAQLAYVDAGPRDGEVVLLLHGLPTSSYLYRDVIPVLTGAGYRVIAPDLIGYGASSKPADARAYRPAAQAARLAGLLDDLAIARVTLVVHDLGGLVGWELLIRSPTRIARLLVMNTTAYAGFRPPVQMRMLAGPMGGMMSGMMGGGMAGRSLTRTFLADNTAHPERVAAALVDSVWWSLHEGATVPMRAMARTFAEVMTAFPRYQAALRAFAGPTALLWGGRDAVLRFDVIARRFIADLRIPAARVRRVDDAGHFLMVDHPELVAAAILALMARPLAAEDAAAPLAAAPAADRAVAVVDASPAPPGPSVTVALGVADRTTAAVDTHDVRAGLRLRTVIGHRLGYGAGLDAEVGGGAGRAYRVAAYPLGVGFAHGGDVVDLVVGAGVLASPGEAARLEVPATIDLGHQLGPVRALAWARVGWTRAGVARSPWDVGLGLRLGGAREYFPRAWLGSGPSLAAIISGVGAERRYGLALGFDLADSH